MNADVVIAGLRAGSAVLLALLSGALGALFVYFLERVERGRRERKEASSLCGVLQKELSALIAILKSERLHVRRVIDPTLLSIGVWRALVPDIIRLLPSELVQEVVHSYLLIEAVAEQVASSDDLVREQVLDKFRESDLLNKIRATVEHLRAFEGLEGRK